MKLRKIENKRQLQDFIFETLSDMEKEFSLTELMEKVLKKSSFDDFCSKELIQT